MLNNKGFAVSSVLYTLLIAFLLFLGAALAQIASSSSLIGRANDDMVNGTQFKAIQLRPNGACDDGRPWYHDYNGISNAIVKIESRYGTIYWPKDFPVNNEDANVNVTVTIDGISIQSGPSDGNKIDVKAEMDSLTFTDTVTNTETSVVIADICK